MGKISIVGLGPGRFDDMTLETLRLLKQGKTYLRTRVHPCVDHFAEEGIAYESFDFLYEVKDSFEEVYANIVERLIDAARTEDIVYAVPGNPLFAEESVEMLISRCEKEDVPYKVYPAVSFVDTVCDTLAIDPNQGLLVTDAFAVIGDEIHRQELDPQCATLISQVYSPYMAGELQLALSKVYDEEEEIIVIRHAGCEDETIEAMALYELGRANVDHLTSVFIPVKPENLRTVAKFDEIVRILRAPDGCPWDREQTHKSLKSCMIEEAYEAVDAIEEEDYDNLQEELGDLLLQILFHAQLADEEGYFNLADVVDGISQKMINRHPHVFGDVTVKDSAEVLQNWDEIKKKEKKQMSISQEMLNIPKSYTALMQAQKIQSKARQEGFDWDEAKPALEKVLEEAAEVLQEIERPQRKQERLEEELGDLLFACVNLARLCDVYAEDALKIANRKFIRRYEAMEALSKKDGKVFKELSLDEQEAYWQKAKKQVRKP